MLTNIPTVKLGIIAVSRDCFIISLSERRRAAVVAACQAKGHPLQVGELLFYLLEPEGQGDPLGERPANEEG